MEKEPLSIQIIHDVLQGCEYRFLSDFFRMNGFFVFNNAIYPDEAELRLSLRQEYTFVILVRPAENGIASWLKEKPTSCAISYYSILQKCVPAGLIELDAIETANSKDSEYSDACVESKAELVGKPPRELYLLHCIQKMKSVDNAVCIPPIEWQALEKNAEIYVKHNLLRHRLAVNTFYYQKELMLAAMHEFWAAVNDCAKTDQSFLDWNQSLESDISFYFIMSLMKYANETCGLADQQTIFDTEKCVERIEQQILQTSTQESNDRSEKNKLYASFKVLQAMFYSVDPYNRFNSERYFLQAIEELHGHQFAGFCYYHLARFYEKQLQKYELAEKYYLIALQLRPNDYKAIYKQAVFLNLKGDYVRSAFAFERIILLLKAKKEQNLLEPKEYEYLFKSYHLLGTLYLKRFGQEEKGTSFYRERDKIAELAKDESRSNSLYEGLFGSEAWSGRWGKLFDVRKLMQERIMRTQCST